VGRGITAEPRYLLSESEGNHPPAVESCIVRRRAVGFVVFWLVSGLFVGIGAIAANPAPDAEDRFVVRIGDERVAAGGLASYAVAADLVDVARRHAEEMASEHRLYHNPRLGDDVQGWQSVGENVGVGSSVEDIHQAFMASQTHRDNVMSATFTEVGLGVVIDGPDLWVVEVFRKPSAGPAAAPAPEPRPTSEPSPAPPRAESVRAARASSSVRPPAAPPAVGGAVATASSPATALTPALASPTTTVAAAPIEPLVIAPFDADAIAASFAAASSAGRVTSPDAVPVAAITAPSSTDVREVTAPIAIAAAMLVLVVAGLATHVGAERARAASADVGPGRRRSIVDAWELALAA
jgi:hypothetical protein